MSDPERRIYVKEYYIFHFASVHLKSIFYGVEIECLQCEILKYVKMTVHSNDCTRSLSRNERNLVNDELLAFWFFKFISLPFRDEYWKTRWFMAWFNSANIYSNFSHILALVQFRIRLFVFRARCNANSKWKHGPIYARITDMYNRADTGQVAITTALLCVRRAYVNLRRWWWMQQRPLHVAGISKNYRTSLFS